jgi:hypothetical protein
VALKKLDCEKSNVEVKFPVATKDGESENETLTVNANEGLAVGLRVTDGSGLFETVGRGLSETVGRGVSESVGFGVAEAGIVGTGLSDKVGNGVSEKVGLGVGVGDRVGQNRISAILKGTRVGFARAVLPLPEKTAGTVPEKTQLLISKGAVELNGALVKMNTHRCATMQTGSARLVAKAR